MFGYQGGESAEIVAKKQALMHSARDTWPFLTVFDCSTIKTQGQLVSMVNIRSGIAHEQAQRDVDAWLTQQSA